MFTKTEKIVFFSFAAFCAIVVVFLLAMTVDLFAYSQEPISAEIINKQHVASSVSTGYAPGNNGGSVVVMSNPEQWTLVMKGSNSVFTMNVASNVWAQAQIGGTLSCERCRGRCLGFVSYRYTAK